MQCHTRVTRKSRGEEGEGSAEPGRQPAVMEATVLQVADRARVGPEAPAVRGGGRPAEVAGSMGQADALGPCCVMGAGDASRPTRPFCRLQGELSAGCAQVQVSQGGCLGRPSRCGQACLSSESDLAPSGLLSQASCDTTCHLVSQSGRWGYTRRRTHTCRGVAGPSPQARVTTARPLQTPQPQWRGLGSASVWL